VSDHVVGMIFDPFLSSHSLLKEGAGVSGMPGCGFLDEQGVVYVFDCYVTGGDPYLQAYVCLD